MNVYKLLERRDRLIHKHTTFTPRGHKTHTTFITTPSCLVKNIQRKSFLFSSCTDQPRVFLKVSSESALCEDDEWWIYTMSWLLRVTCRLHAVESDAGIRQNLFKWSQSSAEPVLCCFESNTKDTVKQLTHKHQHQHRYTNTDTCFSFHDLIYFIHLQSLISLILQDLFSFRGSSTFKHLLWNKEHMKHHVLEHLTNNNN